MKIEFINIKIQPKVSLPFYLLFFIYNFFFISISYSQNLLKLEDAVSIGLKNNYDIQLSKNEFQINKENNTAGNAGMMPNLNLNAGANFALNNSHIEYASGSVTDKPSATTRNYSAGLALNWTIFDGFKMFTTKSKLEEIERGGEIKYRSQLQQSIAQIIEAYYEIVRQKQVLNTIREIIALSKERMTIGETRFNAGLSAKTELLQAQIDFNTQSQNEIQQVNVIAEAKRKLNQIINREINEKFEVTDSIAYSVIDSAYAESKILESNPSVQYFKKQLEIEKLTVKEYESLNLPYINLSAGYGLNLAENTTGLIAINRSNGANVGLNLSYPLFQGGNISRQIQISELNAYSIELQLEAQKKQVRSQFLSSLELFRTNLKMLDIENSTRTLAKENLFLALERLKLAQTTSIEVRDAQLSYENSLTRLSTIYFNLKLAETQLKLLMGEL
ncbi:MAG: TolC family protein [Bacteroidota bacterium]